MTAGLFHVHYSRKRPVDADVAVKHRGYWFYISNCDLNSKSTFNLLQELINLEIRAGRRCSDSSADNLKTCTVVIPTQ